MSDLIFDLDQDILGRKELLRLFVEAQCQESTFVLADANAASGTVSGLQSRLQLEFNVSVSEATVPGLNQSSTDTIFKYELATMLGNCVLVVMSDREGHRLFEDPKGRVDEFIQLYLRNIEFQLFEIKEMPDDSSLSDVILSGYDRCEEKLYRLAVRLASCCVSKHFD